MRGECNTYLLSELRRSSLLLATCGLMALAIPQLRTASAASLTPLDQARTTTSTVLDEVLVSGVQPGPGLWKVSRGSHTLWILGRYGPLPKRMTWRSADVETIIAHSQVLLSPVRVRPTIGFFTGLTLLPSLFGLRDNPNGQRLQDKVPADLYARWRALKFKYVGNDESAEKWRPIFAAHELYTHAIEKTGLEPADVVTPVVERLTRQSHLKRIEPALALKIEQPRATLKEFKKSPLDDVECFARTIARLETDLDLMRARANAWAVGDVAHFRQMTHVDQAGACIAAVLNSQVAQEQGFQTVPARAADAWIAAAESALSQYVSTFAVLSMDQILQPDGYVARLRAKGYVIQDP
jgi:hypothetical protein